MSVSLSVFGLPLDRYAPLAVAAERIGLHAIWLADHLATPTQRRTPYPYAQSGDPGYGPPTPIADVWVMAGHLAAATSRILIGTGVYILPLRPAIVSARAAATAQILSRGRLLFGIGTGWLEEEFAATGESFSDRGARTDEIIRLMRRLWTGAPTSFDGHHVTVPELTVAPAVPVPIPLIVGGVSGPALRRAAAAGDGWYGPACDLRTSLRARRTIEELRDAAGRRGPFRWFVRLPVPYDAATVEQYHASGFDDVVITLAGAGAAADDPAARQIDAVERTFARCRGG